ncbi:hypothetical protein [Helicobacter felis]|uniref:hypothetical protein n=1 Tax=Helicobacter felis TaxID=214 RepID=UPI000CEEF44F|nr:hypothetical protein [Helicobacter felis]
MADRRRVTLISIALREYADNIKERVAISQSSSQEESHERTLHSLLAYFAYHKWRTHIKTIFHERALKGKHGKNSWLYPDMVGASFAYKNFDPQSLFEELKCNLLS